MHFFWGGVFERAFLTLTPSRQPAAARRPLIGEVVDGRVELTVHNNEVAVQHLNQGIDRRAGRNLPGSGADLVVELAQLTLHFGGLARRVSPL